MAHSLPARRSSVVAAFVMGAGIVGCAGISEAWHERTSGRAAVHLGCTEGVSVPEAARPASWRPVLLRVTPVPSPFVVGELFSGEGAGPTVTVADPAPDQVLAEDASALLDAAGYTMSGDPAAATVSLELVALEARQGSAGLDVKGTTTAVVTVQVTATRGGQDRTWRYSGNGRVRSAYLRSRDVESALESAYCGVLSDMLKLFQSDEFLEATGGPP